MIIFTEHALKGISKVSPFDAEIMIAELEAAYEAGGRYVEFASRNWESTTIIDVLNEKEENILMIVGITGLYLCNMYRFGVITCDGKIPIKVLLKSIKQYREN